AQLADHCDVSSHYGDQKLHLRPIPIDQDGINLGPAPDQYRSNTVVPRLRVACWVVSSPCWESRGIGPDSSVAAVAATTHRGKAGPRSRLLRVTGGPGPKPKIDCLRPKNPANWPGISLMQQVNLGMIGGGTVGSGVFHALQLNGGLMASRIGVRVNLRKVAVKAFDEPRPYAIPASQMTTDWQSVVADPQVDVVAELVGGTTLARTMILVALKLGKPVITANKALLSAHGEELFAAAQQYGTNLYYEASVCGGIPIIKALREGLVGTRITRLYGIVNGTCNYILTRMKLEGADVDTVLKDAQAQGYAEAEPSLDIDGHDAM